MLPSIDRVSSLIREVAASEILPRFQKLAAGDSHEKQPGQLVTIADLEAERRGRAALLEAIRICESKQDYVSRDLLTAILDDTEEHIDFLETELDVLAQIGLENYLQSQYKTAE